MRAVNLIPLEERGPGGGRGGRGAHILIGGLAAVLVLVVVYVLAANAVKDKRNELARVQAEAAQAQAAADALAPYGRFADLAQARLETVRSLARSRFDWAHALRGLAVAIPDDVRLQSLTGSISTDTGNGAGGGESGGLRGAINVPAIELRGCTRSHPEVARMIAQLRQVDGVTRVSLSNSDKGANGDAGACTARPVSFGLVLFFGASTPPPPSAPAAASGAAAAPAGTPAGGSAPTPPATIVGGRP